MTDDPVRMARRVFLVVGLAAIAAFFFFYLREYSKGEARQRASREEQRSGKTDFGDQPALFAVAQAIVQNDQQAIRTAAAALPDLQTPGRDGATLLNFAITSSWQRPELVDAVQTLLSLGADPNHRAAGRESAMANAVHSSTPVLRAMLDAGGNPNTLDHVGWPIILRVWYLGYYQQDQRARLDLLLDRGANINSVVPPTDSDEAGYTVLLYRMNDGPKNEGAYVDALHLLKRGADPNHVARDGMTLAKMLTQQRDQYWREKEPPASFQAIWDGAQNRGLVK